MPRSNPTVIAYHLCWTAYGTWLPNDPRGSGSKRVATTSIAELGQRHYGRRKSQPEGSVVREFYQRAEEKLRFSVTRFDARQIESIAVAFGDAIAEQGYTCYACAILPDHVHLVIRKHKDRAEAMIEVLQRFSRWRLGNQRAMPLDHPVWTTGGWRGFLDSPDAVRNAVRYVEKNPAKSGLKPQSWPFVTTYDGWPFHKRPSVPK
jgi:hypothetical protein